MNRKASENIGTTMTWIIATLIIIVIMGILIVAVSGIKVSRTIELKIFGLFSSEGKVVYDAEVTGELIDFLNMQIDFNGNKIMVYDFLKDASSEDKDKVNKFNEIGEKFLEDNFPASNFNKVWLRLYDKNEEILKYPYKNPPADEKGPQILLMYYGYEVYSGAAFRLGSFCDPAGKSSSYAYVFIYPNKKIALCAE